MGEGIIKRITGIFKKKKVEEINFASLDLFTHPFKMDDLDSVLHGVLADSNRKKKNKIPVKPMDIIHDFEFNVDFPKNNIKEAIKELEIRVKFMKKTLKVEPEDEIRALGMLKARYKYPKYSKLFRWKTTTLRHITGIMGRYELDHQNIYQYIRSIPHEAIVSMQSYAKVMKKVSDKTPVFSLIAPPSYFENPKNQTDPILLAESPFGDYYYILCAWDKEISYVSELLDGEELVIDKNGKSNGKIKKVKK